MGIGVVTAAACTVIVVLPDADQFPALSFSCTYRVWSPFGSADGGVNADAVPSDAPVLRFVLSSFHR